MTGQTPHGERPKRVPELRTPYPLLDYLQTLKGDYLKLTLRLLQRAQWKAGVTETGIAIDAGEVLISLRSRDIWDAVRLDRQLGEAGRVSLLRRVLGRLERDGIIATRPAHRIDTPSGARSGTSSETPPTIVRFLMYRDNLWPGNQDATQESTRASTQGAAHPSDPIPADKPATPAIEEEGDASPATGSAAAHPSTAGLDEVRSLVARAAAAYLEVKGLPYQHARKAAVMADRRAAAELLSVPGIQPDTVEQVWRWVLPQADWPRIETLPDLAAHWGVVAPRALLASRETAAAPQPSVTPAPITCQVWAAMAVRLRRDLRTDLYERWFAPLGAEVSDGELVLSAPDRFHRDFVHDNYLCLLGELLERSRSEQESYRGVDRLRVVAEGETERPSTASHTEPSQHQETSRHAQHQA
jgi:DnaA N-terminal domain